MKFKHLFGPVPSRRLGISLGIDLVPYKTCNLNCIYCECGITTNHTNERKEYVNIKEIINELDEYLQIERELDYITFSGAGEPLLNSQIGEISIFLKEKYPKYKLALLTNGILLSNKTIIEQIKYLDLIIPSLDSGTEKVFKKINRPCAKINFRDYINGLINLKKHFRGEVWLEIFLLKNINNSGEELENLKNIALKIEPDKIQLNTIDRPPAEVCEGLDYNSLLKIKNFFGTKAEIVKNFREKKVVEENKFDLIKNCLKRRPLTIEDLKIVTSLKIEEINKILDILEKSNNIQHIKGERGIFYKFK